MATMTSERSGSSSAAGSFSEPSIIRSMSQRLGGAADDRLFYDSALRYKTVRKEDGQRADAEAIVVTMPTQQMSTDYGAKTNQQSGLPARSLSIGQGGIKAAPFSTVRRIFRQRSKSISSAMRRPMTTEVIPEADEIAREATESPALSSSHSNSNHSTGIPRRERKLSLFKRSKIPPQSKVDVEGVDSQKRLSFPSVIIRHQMTTPTEERKSAESFRSRSTPPTSPLVASRSLNGLLTSSDRANQMQGLDGVISQVRRQSMEEKRSNATNTPTPSDMTSANGTEMASRTSSRRGVVAQEGEEDNVAMRGLKEHEEEEEEEEEDREEEEEGTGVAYSTSASSPSKSVSKMWQSADSNHLSTTTSQPFMNRLLTPSAASDSIASFRTAGSTPRARTPSRGPPKSPLSDLIYNLEERSTDRADHLSLAQDTPTRRANDYNPPPFSRIRHLEDDGESLESSQSSEDRRNTFGNTPEIYNPGQWSSNFANNTIAPTDDETELAADTTTPMKRRTVGDMSMSEIETSLLAVEAALLDHSIEGSFDPNHLRKKMLTPRHASILGHDVEEDDSEMPPSPRARVRLPPSQQVAIQEAVSRVRRALSSSHLPQIPNEDDFSEATHSAVTESTPVRAARKRQESMQDVEEAYARMVDLVGSAAGIDLNALSPLPSVLRPPSGSYNLHQMSFTDVGKGNISYPSPDKRPRSMVPEFAQDATMSASAHGHDLYLSAAQQSAAQMNNLSNRTARQQLLKDSDALARISALGRAPREMEEVAMRGRPSQVSLGSRRYASESPPRRRLESNESSTAKVDHTRQNRPHRISVDGVGTSPSATAKTQGTPQSVDQYYHHNFSMPNSVQAHHSHSLSQPIHDWHKQQQQQTSRISTSPTIRRGSNAILTFSDPNRPLSGENNYEMIENTSRPIPINGEMQRYEGALSRYEASRDVLYATTALQKRHALERDSLLDMLERSRSESSSLRMRNEELEADLHQEVTRVLEMQREMHRLREVEQSFHQNEQMMQERIQNLENALRREQGDRMHLAAFVERFQHAIDRAGAAEANVSAGATYDSTQTLPSASTSPLFQEDLLPSARHVIDDSMDSNQFSHTFNDTTSLLEEEEEDSHDIHLGTTLDDQEKMWKTDVEEPAQHRSSNIHPYEMHAEEGEDRENQAPTGEAATQSSTFKPQFTPATKRFSHSNPANSRLPLLASAAMPRSPPPSNIPTMGMTKSTSTTSTITPSTPNKMYLGSPRRKPAGSPAITSSRIPLADRFGESMIARPRNYKGATNSGGGASQSSISTSPQSMRNLSISSSSRFGAPRKMSNYTNTTGGDTSAYSARTPSTIDVTTLHFNDDEDSLSR